MRSASRLLASKVVGREDRTSGLRLLCLSSAEPRNELGISGQDNRVLALRNRRTNEGSVANLCVAEEQTENPWLRPPCLSAVRTGTDRNG